MIGDIFMEQESVGSAVQLLTFEMVANELSETQTSVLRVAPKHAVQSQWST